MNSRALSPRRRSQFLTAISTWRRLTVPLAVALVVAQTIGVMYCRVEAATQSFASGFDPAGPPVPYSAEGFEQATGTSDPAGIMTAEGGAGGSLVDESRRAEIMTRARAEMYHFAPDHGSPSVHLLATNPDH